MSCLSNLQPSLDFRRAGGIGFLLTQREGSCLDPGQEPSSTWVFLGKTTTASGRLKKEQFPPSGGGKSTLTVPCNALNAL